MGAQGFVSSSGFFSVAARTAASSAAARFSDSSSSKRRRGTWLHRAAEVGGGVRQALHRERAELAREHRDAHRGVLEVLGEVDAQHGDQPAHARVGDAALDLALHDALQQRRHLRRPVPGGAAARLAAARGSVVAVSRHGSEGRQSFLAPVAARPRCTLMVL